MHSYLEHILESFNVATGWNADNQYSNLTASSRDLLDFSLPSGFILNVSALSSGSSASSYSIKNLGGIVDGAASYFYCSPDHLLDDNKLSTENVDLIQVLRGYHVLQPPAAPEDAKFREVWHRGRRVDSKNSILYGKMYLPTNTLEALYIRQISPINQIVVSTVSDARLRNGGTMMIQLQRNTGKWCSEFLYSTDEALFGLRGLYNFGFDAEAPPQQSWLSAGGEIYYGVFNKAPGVSSGLRYTTISAYTNTPMTMTVTLNPIMGQISASYAVMSTTNTTFASRYDFNAFSYESDLTLGCELWKRRPSDRSEPIESITEVRDDVSSTVLTGQEHTHMFSDEAVWKARMSTSSPTIRLLWEGRMKAFVFSVGSEVDLRPGQGLKSFGVELQYAS
ncbi:hypothetical protein V1512DRAFT_259724 [Lipomyces arxii]|uniref:uncharacterized protein n=1 Tax=Lipomyces arxii TaxID=56418 RepID=UPI0034CEECBB